MIPCDFKISSFVAPLLDFCYSCFLLAESHKYYEVVVVVVVVEFFLKLTTIFKHSI
jgi:hypothetical protein